MKTIRLPLVAAIVSLGLASSGCAAIVASKTDTLSVDSDPQGAEVRLNGNVVGKTPTSVPITRKAPEAVEVVLSGRETQKCPVTMTAGGGYIAGDVLFCVFLFPIGCISWIDAGGDWNTLVNPHCTVTLRPSAEAPKPSSSVPPSTWLRATDTETPRG